MPDTVSVVPTENGLELRYFNHDKTLKGVLRCRDEDDHIGLAFNLFKNPDEFVVS